MGSGNREVGIREAKAELSKILRRVKRGESIDITERGERIARISPFRKADLTLEEQVERLEKEGILVRGKLPSRSLPNPVKLSGLSASATLRSHRDEEE